MDCEESMMATPRINHDITNIVRNNSNCNIVTADCNADSPFNLSIPEIQSEKWWAGRDLHCLQCESFCRFAWPIEKYYFLITRMIQTIRTTRPININHSNPIGGTFKAMLRILGIITIMTIPNNK